VDIEILIKSEPDKEAVNFNLKSFGGLLNNKSTLGALLRKLYKAKDEEKDFIELLDKVFPQIEEKIKKELEIKRKIVIVTPTGEETFYSNVLKKYLKEKLFSF